MSDVAKQQKVEKKREARRLQNCPRTGLLKYDIIFSIYIYGVCLDYALFMQVMHPNLTLLELCNL